MRIKMAKFILEHSAGAAHVYDGDPVVVGVEAISKKQFLADYYGEMQGRNSLPAGNFARLQNMGFGNATPKGQSLLEFVINPGFRIMTLDEWFESNSI
jgi:hypothetical protein